MPSRKIRAGHRAVRGYFPSRKNHRQISFESTFERDFFYLLELDPNVIGYVEQPIKIELQWGSSTWLYTPDVYVEVRDSTTPIYYEVKPSVDDFPSDKRKAMDRWCVRDQSRFDVIDAIRIRSSDLNRAKFLYPYLRFTPDPKVVATIFSLVKSLERLKASELVEVVQCRLGDVYHLVAIGALSADGIPNMKSLITLGEVHE